MPTWRPSEAVAFRHAELTSHECYRFSYCALACCSLLGKLGAINVPEAAEFVARCNNFDGGFGVTPGVASVWPISCVDVAVHNLKKVLIP